MKKIVVFVLAVISLSIITAIPPYSPYNNEICEPNTILVCFNAKSIKSTTGDINVEYNSDGYG